VDFNKLVTRAKNILFTPKTEWPVIASEPATIGDIYKNYVLILAALPVVASFLGMTLLTRFLGVGMGFALTSAIVGYALALGSLYLLSLIADALAPSFGGQKDPVQAFKLVAYAYTASWVAGIAAILPLISLLIALVALGYGIYLLYLGAPHTVKTPQDKTAGYIAVLIIIAIVMQWILAAIVGLVIGGSLLMGGGSRGIFSSVQHDSDEQKFDKDSPMGKLEQFGKSMEDAGKKMEAAQKSGDSQAQGDAFKNMMGTMLSGGQGVVESLPPDRLKEFVPASLAGLSRHSIEVSRNNALGVQVSEAKASFEQEGEPGSLHLEITDAGGAKAMLGLASWAAVESEKETQSGYDKTYRENGRMIHEKWDRDTSSGEYSIVIADRFMVELTGKAGSIGELKSAMSELDLGGLEAVKNEGVKAR
jgi:hypothetical protein